MSADRYDVVIVGGGSAGCALANRLSADPAHQRAGARGRPLRLPDRPVHPHAGGAADPDRQPALRLEVRDRPRAAHERPPDLPRPRQGARRLVQHQRDDLPARQPDGLRALGRRAGDGGRGTTSTACPTSSGWRPCLLEDGADGADEWRGGAGPLVLERGPATNPLFGAFFEAAQQAGYPLTDDVNGYRRRASPVRPQRPPGPPPLRRARGRRRWRRPRGRTVSIRLKYGRQWR